MYMRIGTQPPSVVDEGEGGAEIVRLRWPLGSLVSPGAALETGFIRVRIEI